MSQRDHRMPQECRKERRLLAGSLTFSAVSTESQWAWRGARFVAMSWGGLASSAWHIDQMGQPPRSDVWACAQSNVQWWMSIRSAGGACSYSMCACIQDRRGRHGERWSRRASEERRRASENADEGRCCWPSALIQVPDQPWPSALL